MKNIVLTALAALGVMACPAKDIELLGGDILLKDVKVERSESRLIVRMDIDTRSLRQNGNTETMLVPVLVGQMGDSLRMQEVVISGRNRYYNRLRNASDDDTYLLYRSSKDLTSVPYQAVVEYRPWMEQSALSVEFGQSECGCDIPLTPEPLIALDFKPRIFAPQYVFITPEAEAVKMRDLKGSAYIDFPVNRTELYPDYRRNPQELAEIRKTIDVVRNDSNVTITSFSIKGFASPEGSYSNNVRLAKGRTATLKDYVQKLYAFNPDIMHTSYEPEDWEGLRKYVESSNIANREGILAIIDSDLAPDPKNAKIQKTYPEQYAFLLREEYPALRHSDYTINYVVRTFTSVEEIKRVLRTAPQNLSLNELFLVAQSYEPGSDDYREVFEVAVRMFPNDKVANLNAANIAIQRGEYDKARAYLAKAGDTPQATYARGLIEAFEKNYDAALPLFDKAASESLTEAAEAAKQIHDIIEHKNNQ